MSVRSHQFGQGGHSVSGPALLLFQQRRAGHGQQQGAAAAQLAQAGKIKLDGDQSALTAFAGLPEEFDPDFNIITP